MTSLFDSTTMAGLSLPNRLAMAPMNRGRVDDEGVPSPLMATYYAQRASAGLLISDSSYPAPLGRGYRMPGMCTPDHVEGWRRVTRAVHLGGGRIFVQLQHAGRISHPDLLDGELPIAPSAVRPPDAVLEYEGRKPFEVPRALTTEGVEEVVREFAEAARRAVLAGADGVELQGANGYLLHQFMGVNTNLRTDRYGGSAAARARMAIETATACAQAVGAHRVGIRLSPGNIFNDMDEGDTPALYEALLPALARLGLAYVHVVENGDREYTRLLRKLWPYTMIVSPRHGPMVHPTTGRFAEPVGLAAAREVLDEQLADLVSFGRHFIANPDLPRRLAEGAPLNEVDPATLYPGHAAGYTDYPALP
ncbi:alkene reductase [Streptomyces sp. NPDC059524]|uniref:alkene reductase n=1 Tax=Streptomyces sp. NPDC059524 TaxID=3346856 RepID=UPI0036B3E729